MWWWHRDRDVPAGMERRRGEDRTRSPGLARRQLCKNEWRGSVSQRGKTSPQAYSWFPKRQDVGGAVSCPEEDARIWEQRGPQPGCVASLDAWRSTSQRLWLQLPPERPCAAAPALLLPSSHCSSSHPVSGLSSGPTGGGALLCARVPQCWGAGCQGAGHDGAEVLGARMPTVLGAGHYGATVLNAGVLSARVPQCWT